MNSLGQFLAGRKADNSDQDHEQLVKDLEDAKLGLSMARDDEDDARQELHEAYDLIKIWKGYQSTVEVHGIGALSTQEKEAYEGDSDANLEKMVNDRRNLKTAKTTSRISAQKAVSFASSELEKFACKLLKTNDKQ